ncbi:unnamed protein product [Lathyrus oleraceus]
MTYSTSIFHTIFDATSVNIKRKRKTRCVMMYIKVKKAHENGLRYPVTIDIRIRRAYGEHVEDFMGYIMLQGRSKVSILHRYWHEVDKDLKDAIWNDVKEVFDVSPDDSMVKKKLLTYDVECWRSFKTRLTRDYIKHPRDEDDPEYKPSYLMYSFIDRDFLEKFVKSRTTPKFLAKSQKRKENRARNIYPHKLSRGGYQKFEKNTTKENAYHTTGKRDTTTSDQPL